MAFPSPPSLTLRAPRRVWVPALAFTALTIAVLAVTRYAFHLDLARIDISADGVVEGGASVVFGWLTSWKTWLGVGVILGWERLRPAVRAQPINSTGLWEDLVHAVVSFGLWMVVVDAYLVALDHLFRGPLASWRLDLAGSWPVWLLLPVAYLLGDFAAWFHHYVRHKVPLFWRFHAVHHSQSEMNVFTDFRVHPVDVIVARTIMFLPFFLLGGLYSYEVHAISALLFWHSHLYHANVDSDFGPLKYVLVTPQSHRVHHSQQREYYDLNFGVNLCIWDRLFRTHHDAAPGEYPVTGVPDRNFPLEGTTGVGPLRTYWRQMVYPFRPRRTSPEAAVAG
jgi:sterol desaturase/sphingolipid hydroxylase (fatty acid hydroxylase superfamily)